MNLGRALLGFIGVGTILICFGLAAVVVRRRWFPAVAAPLQQLVDVTLSLAGILGTGLVLGSIGLFRAAPLVLVSVVIGVAAAARLWNRGEALPAQELTAVRGGADEQPRLVLAAIAVAPAIVAVRWVTELLETLGRGFSHTDELHYHLTHAAMFAQSGRTWPIRFASIGDGAAYHPANSELLHAVGLSVVGSDFLSIFINLAFAAMAMAAGWTLGRQAGNAPVGALLVGSVLSLWPSAAESGTALNDIMAIALLLSAAAFMIEAASRGGSPRFTVLAGIAAGLGAGTKLTVLVPVVALALLILAWPAPTRLRTVTIYVGAASVVGGYWYLRNLVFTGNPVPALSFGPLPGPELEFQRSVESPITDYLVDLSIWREYFVPGLERVFGSLWPMFPTLAVVSGLAALSRSAWRSGRMWTLLGVCGFAALLAYVVTPTSAGGPPGAPYLFALNLRYAFPGLLLCAFAGLAHPAVRRHPQRASAVAIVLFVASNLRGEAPGRATVALIIVAVAIAGIWVAWRHPVTRPIMIALVLTGGMAGGVLAEDQYLDRRWEGDRARWSGFRAMQHTEGLRIGVTGFPQNYPFFGTDLSNEVTTLADDSRGDELVPFTACHDFRHAIAEDDLDVVVVLSERGFAMMDFGQRVISAPTRWLHDSDVPVLLRGRDVEIFDVSDTLPRCDR